MRILAIAILSLCSVPKVIGQDAAPSFDVVSIKPSDTLATGIMRPALGSDRAGVWRAHDQTLAQVLRSAYPDIRLAVQMVGAPDWVNRDFYNIEARTSSGATVDEMRQMLRTLLAQRFKLAAHQEQRDVLAFVLVKRRDAKVGNGLTSPSVDCTAFRADGPRPADPALKANADRLPCAVTALPAFDHTVRIAGADMRITAGDVPISRILTLLGNYLQRPVVDHTGLTQRFDIELQFVADPDRSSSGNGPPLRTAIAEQLGLQVESGRTSIDVLVIDHIERPTEN